MIAVIAIALALYYLRRKQSPVNPYVPIIYSGAERQGRIDRTLKFANVIIAKSLKYKVDPAVISAIVATESEGVPCKYAKGRYDTYYGLMQIGYRTAQYMGYTGSAFTTPYLYSCPPMTGLFVPEINLEYGAKYFADHFKKTTNLKYAVSSYQVGSLKFNNSAQLVNMGYVRTVLDFAMDFRKYYKGVITDYEGMFPASLWDPAVVLV